MVRVDVGGWAVHRPAFGEIPVGRGHGFQAFVKVDGLTYVVVVQYQRHGFLVSMLLFAGRARGRRRRGFNRLRGADGVDAFHRGGMGVVIGGVPRMGRRIAQVVDGQGHQGFFHGFAVRQQPHRETVGLVLVTGARYGS